MDMENLTSQAAGQSELQPAAKPELSELRAQYESLRSLVVSLLVLLLIISGTFNLYLLREVKYSRDDLAALRPRISRLVADYDRVTAPLIKNFVTQLQEFGKKNPDFTPILAKYHLTPGSTPNTAPAAPSAMRTTTPGAARAAAPAPGK